ncbi:MAG: hypothetical protein P0120_22205 [Nitrospira sp.]|nr:hypothetical protein [Nitrospira sp.]
MAYTLPPHKWHAIGVYAANCDDTPAVAHMTRSLLGGGKDTTDVNRNHAVEIRERILIEWSYYSYTGVIDQDVKATKRFDGLGNGTLYGLRIGTVGANGDRSSAAYLNGMHDVIGPLLSFDIGNGDLCTFGGQTFGDCSADATRGTGHQRNFSFK